MHVQSVLWSTFVLPYHTKTLSTSGARTGAHAKQTDKQCKKSHIFIMNQRYARRAATSVSRSVERTERHVSCALCARYAIRTLRYAHVTLYGTVQCYSQCIDLWRSMKLNHERLMLNSESFN